jgi:putative ABC transport system permease protein
MLQDFRYALRSLAHAPGFTAAAVLTLSLGLAANTVVYSIVNGLVLRPLPFGDRAERLITIHSTHPTQAQDWDDSELSYPDLIDLRDRVRSLEAVEGVLTRNLSLASADDAQRVMGASITPGLFDLLGVSPAIGRGFTEADGAEPGRESVAIISHAIWQRLYSGDPEITRRTILVNARAIAIVGVMPPRFAFPENQDIWLPYRTDRAAGRDRRNLTTVGLLRPGTTLNTARSELGGIAAALSTEHPVTNRQWGLHAMALRDLFVGDSTRRGLNAMLFAVGFVLLVACANVAGLLVARGIGRRRELAVRMALGASRARLIRLLFTESLILAVLGGALGALAASWGLDGLVASMPEPPVYWARFEIDSGVLAFISAVTVITAVACGLLPALRAGRTGTSAGTFSAARTATSGVDQRRLQGLLVAGQVALSLALLVAATLLARSAMMLQHSSIGFETEPLLSLRFYIAGNAYDQPVARARAVDRVVARLRSLPGAESAAAVGAIPGDDGGEPVRFVPPDTPVVAGEEIGAQLVPITPAFFDTLGLRPIAGRTFDSGETENPDSNAVIVSQRLARRLWPDGDGVNREVRAITAQGPATMRVVGVAPDMVYEELGEESEQSRLIVYVPYVRAGWRTMALLVRATASPETLASAARQAVRAVDPAFAEFEVLTMPERRAMTTWSERFIGRTFSLFAAIAMVLACVGAYGLTSQAAAERTREIGVRLAIGARRIDIVRLFVGRGVRLALAGAAAGLPLAAGAARLVEGLLFEVSPWEISVWLALPVALIAAVLAANYLPARTASRTDPAVALRAE